MVGITESHCKARTLEEATAVLTAFHDTVIRNLADSGHNYLLSTPEREKELTNTRHLCSKFFKLSYFNFPISQSWILFLLHRRVLKSREFN